MRCIYALTEPALAYQGCATAAAGIVRDKAETTASPCASLLLLQDTLPQAGQAGAYTGSEHFLQYEGQWERGRRQGEGRLWDASGCCYTGALSGAATSSLPLGV
jgi:hypothetical protein